MSETKGNGKLFFPYEDDAESVVLPSLIEKIYGKMADNTSKQIFEKRLMYSMTSDHGYIREMLDSDDVGGGKLHQLFRKCEQKIYIYGAGIKGGRIVKIYDDIIFSGFVDRYKKGEYVGLRILDVEDLKKEEDPFLLLISNTDGFTEIKEELLQDGISEENLLVLKELESDTFRDKYFDPRCVGSEWTEGKAFVDAGCYDGEDVMNFYSWCKTKAPEAYAFEADEENYKICSHNLRAYKNVKLMNCGLSDCDTALSFNGKGKTDSSFLTSGDNTVEVHPLDNLVPHDKIAFIKADVEGFEEKFLCGASKTIWESHPTLAISVYHKRSDIWKLPEKILAIYPEYRFYLRHYTFGLTDTVLYGVT